MREQRGTGDQFGSQAAVGLLANDFKTYRFWKSERSLGLGCHLTVACRGKPLRGESVKVVVVKCLFVLLLGLVFGYVLQSASLLVRAVDNWETGSGSSVFTAYR